MREAAHHVERAVMIVVAVKFEVEVKIACTNRRIGAGRKRTFTRVHSLPVGSERPSLFWAGPQILAIRST
jgi:hypothetical protein